MSIVAFFLERILTRSVKKKAPDPVPTTLTSKGARSTTTASYAGRPRTDSSSMSM